MKRVYFEWGTIFTLTLSLVFFAYWVASITSDVADFELSFGWRSVSISAADGAITFGDDLGNQEMIEIIENSIPFDPPLNPTKRLECDLPGIRFRCYTFPNDSPIWSVKLSMLFPAALMMVVAVFCIRRYRRIRAASVTSGQPAPGLGGPDRHPLD